MSLLKTEKCPICGVSVKPFEKVVAKYNGKHLCKACANKLSSSGVNLISLKNNGLDELQKIVGTSNELQENRRFKMSQFNITKNLGGFLYVDEGNKKIGIPLNSNVSEEFEVFDYSDIISYEIIEDGQTLATGGLGRALIGGAFFGLAGAIAGGTSKKIKSTCNKLQIKENINNMNRPTMYINLIESLNVKKSGSIYKSASSIAQDIISILEIISHENEVSKNSSSSDSIAEEIKKYKELLDIGAITQEEFDAKKKQLLQL